MASLILHVIPYRCEPCSQNILLSTHTVAALLLLVQRTTALNAQVYTRWRGNFTLQYISVISKMRTNILYTVTASLLH
jgi:hypothetical protein